MENKNDSRNKSKKSFFNVFRSGCCNIKIVPKEESDKEAGNGGCCDIWTVAGEQASARNDTKS